MQRQKFDFDRSLLADASRVAQGGAFAVSDMVSGMHGWYPSEITMLYSLPFIMTVINPVTLQSVPAL